ncbi:hypothetical protein [Brevundimonas denitrificans]|nr:hypothetical protein [Brevundimonas denitrificans]
MTASRLILTLLMALALATTARAQAPDVPAGSIWTPSATRPWPTGSRC